MKTPIEDFMNKDAYIKIGLLNISVFVQSTKQSYGKERYLVTPVTGSGSIWVESVYFWQEN